jgi:hypothetical protein
MEILALTIVGTVVGTILALEAGAWMPYLSRALVRSTLGRMPVGLDPHIRARWTEEIEADLGAYADRPIGGLAFALRLRRRGGRRLAEQLALAETVVPSAQPNKQPDAKEYQTLGHSITGALEEPDGRKVIFISYKDGSFGSREIDPEGKISDRRVSGDNIAFVDAQFHLYVDRMQGEDDK